jgi:predicted N-acyltransferase
MIIQEGWGPYEDNLKSSWDAFVQGHPQGRFIHLTGFKKTVEAVYKLRPNYWVYGQAGEVKAVFPSFFHKSILYGKRLVSQPFSEYGGILLFPGLEARRKLEILAEFPAVIEKSRQKESFDYVEMRCFPELEGLDSGLFQKESLYSYGTLRLDKNLDVWNHVDYSVRKNIKKARSSNLKLQAGAGAEEIKHVFYPLHVQSLKRLGSPPHPLAYFLALQNNFKDRMMIFIARHEETPISALLGWAVGSSVQITDIVSDERYFPLRGNDFLHFELIQWAVSHGYKCFDFGPVRYPGQMRYKKKWGLEFHEYSYFYIPFGKMKKPLSDRSLFGRTASTVWKHLVPRGVAARAGKFLRRELSL